MTTSAPINWTELLVGRTIPPPGWWVALAIERKVSTVELRASAVVALLAEPLCLRLGPPPYLAAVPRLALEWISVLAQTDAFIALGDSGLKSAVAALATAVAARDTLVDPKAPDLVPELQQFCAVAASLVKVLKAHGCKLPTEPMPAAERAALEAEREALRANANRPAADQPRQTAKAKPIRRQQQQRQPQPPMQPAEGTAAQSFSSTADALGLL
jgi:hypothetical protein